MGDKSGDGALWKNEHQTRTKTEQLSRLHYKYYIHIDILSFPHKIFYSAKAQTYKKNQCVAKTERTKKKHTE